MPTQSTALVTGATQGIGRATAFALGRAGYRVGVCARTAPKVEALVAELRAEGIEAAGAAADVADPEQVRRAVAQVVEQLGEIGVLSTTPGCSSPARSRSSRSRTGTRRWPPTSGACTSSPARCSPACGGGARAPS